MPRNGRGRLETESIRAPTPQAKGRLERANQTRQDRLVKEMLLPGTATMEEAQRVRAGLYQNVNQTVEQKFAAPPRDANHAHHPWGETGAARDEALARREERVLPKALTFRPGGMMYCIKTGGPGTAPERRPPMPDATSVMQDSMALSIRPARG